MQSKKLTITLFFSLCFYWALAQSEEQKQSVIESRIELVSENLDEESDIDLTVLFDDLIYYFDHPLNINNASKEDLFQFYILDEFQVNALLTHIDKFGKLISIYELQTIEGFDLQTIRFLQPFIKVNDETDLSTITWNNLWKEGNNDLFLRFQTVLEEQKGYSPISIEELAENPNRRYLGNRDRYYLRYRYKYRNNLSFGMTAEKDPGEEFFKGSQKNGFDYYSSHLFYTGSGIVRKIALGDYGVNFGQGLTFNSNLAFGKSVFVMNIKKSGQGLRPYTSVDENRFMRGSGVTVGWKDFELTTFYSNKKVDGNKITIADTTDNQGDLVIVSSLQSSGLHRTVNELEDKDAIREEIFGTNLAYKTRRFKLGASAYKSKYKGELQRELQFSNQFEFNSSKNFVGGIDYNWITNNYNFFGEVSRSESGGMAYINGVIMALDPHLSLSILHRHFENDYQNLLTNAFAEGSAFSNERGLYMGLELNFSRKWNIVGYFDQYSFPWLKFQVDAPSKGYDYLVQLTYKPERSDEFYLRFRRETKDKNDNSIDDIIDSPVTETRSYFRIHGSYKVSETIKLKSRVEWSHYDMGDRSTEEGFIFFQDLQFKKNEWPVSLSLRYALFDMESYDSRIYAYENDLLYAWSVPAYFNQGSRFYVMAKWRIFGKTDLWVRYSKWAYNNADAISSGLNEISGSDKTELKIQLRIRF